MQGNLALNDDSDEEHAMIRDEDDLESLADYPLDQ